MTARPGRARRRAWPAGAARVEQVSTAVAPPPVLAVAPPPVPTLPVPLGATADVVELTDPDPPVELCGPDLRPAVDVLPTALREPLFPVRSREVELAPPRAYRAALPEAALRAPAVRLAAPPVRRAAPPGLLDVRLRPTPPERVAPERLRGCLGALLRAAAVDAADLVLVGLFEPVPGGRIRGVTTVPGGVRLRLAATGSVHPATLVVARRRSSGALVTAEVARDASPAPADGACR